MNRSRHRMSAAYLLAMTLIMGLMSALFLAPVHAMTTTTAESTETSDVATPEMVEPAPNQEPAPGGEDPASSEDGAAEPPASTDSPSDAAPGTQEPAEEPLPPENPAPAPAAPVVDPPREPDTGSVEEPPGNGSGGGDSGHEDGGTVNEGTDPGTTPAQEDSNPAEPITLNPAPGTLPQAHVGEPYSARLSAEGGAGGYRYRVISRDLLPLPDGLELNSSSGVLSGVPSSVGDYTFTVEVSTTGSAEPIQQAYSINVAGTELGISVAESPAGALQSARVGEPMSIAFGTSGGSGPYTYSIGGALLADSEAAQGARARVIADQPSLLAGPDDPSPDSLTLRRVDDSPTASNAVGNLPAPLRLDSTGTLQGIPQKPGTYEFTLVSTDRYGSSAAKDFTLRILAAGEQPDAVVSSVQESSPAGVENPAPAPAGVDDPASAPAAGEASSAPATGGGSAPVGATVETHTPGALAPAASGGESAGANDSRAEASLAETGTTLEVLVAGLVVLGAGAGLLLLRRMPTSRPHSH